MCTVCLEGELSPSPPPAESRRDRERDEVDAIGRAFVAATPTVDMHAHPGRFFLTKESSGTALAAQLGAPFVERSLSEMRRGGVAAVMFATVADHILLEQSDRGLRAAREFAPGEAYRDHQRQMQVFAEITEHNDVRKVTNAADVRGAQRGIIATMLSIEGGDFIEDRLDRIAEARAAGVRAITIIHYHVNKIGDTQTEPASHGGLTPLGAKIVGAMEAAGILVDLAHASSATCRGVFDVANRPLMMSHSNLRRAGQDHPRLVELETARCIVDSGGMLGAVPAGFNQNSFEDYLDTICDMVERLGIDHVGIGTDMDYTYRPVMAGYLEWPRLAGSLLGRGMNAQEVGAVMGGNMLRLLGEQA